MKIYKYYNYDIYDLTSEEEYDLKGEEYRKFIELCCKINHTLSFSIGNPNICSQEIQRKLEKYEIACPNHNLDIHYYQICSELCELLLDSVSSIFSWIGYIMPEDITFYRLDGSIFLKTSIHEGELTLMPRDNEDVFSIISNKHWIECDY